MLKNLNLISVILAISACISGGVVASAISQTPSSKPAQNRTLASGAAQSKQPAAIAAAVSTTASASHFHAGMASRARKYYELVWGVNDLKVRSVESGELIRFNYRVVDPAKAQLLNDKKFEPFLVDETAHVRLSIPSLEKVGQLRQSPSPEAGKIYWMAFSNKGGYVKVGHQVGIVIGNFRAIGLVVE